MWPAGIEPATPRVSDGRSTGLSYDHLMDLIGQLSNLPKLVEKLLAAG